MCGGVGVGGVCVCVCVCDFTRISEHTTQLTRADPGFLKEGMPKLRTDRTSTPVGTGGVWEGCAPSEAEKNGNFQSQFTEFGAFFLPGAPIESQVPYLCKK